MKTKLSRQPILFCRTSHPSIPYPLLHSAALSPLLCTESTALHTFLICQCYMQLILSARPVGDADTSQKPEHPSEHFCALAGSQRAGGLQQRAAQYWGGGSSISGGRHSFQPVNLCTGLCAGRRVLAVMLNTGRVLLFCCCALPFSAPTSGSPPEPTPGAAGAAAGAACTREGQKLCQSCSPLLEMLSMQDAA